jgi:ubiquitin-like-conjugating enzyme ATG10
MHGGLPPRYFRIPCTAKFQGDGYLSIRDIKSANDMPYRVRRDYHILLAQTWQVPVLYFSAFWEETLEPLTLNEIYKILVDDSSEEAIKDVSIMGGISHPILGTPFYFIHPCRTADLLKDIQAENNRISAQELLQVWIGLAGGVIGIPTPVSKS